jgi:hypothetical protein
MSTFFWQYMWPISLILVWAEMFMGFAVHMLSEQ